MAISTIHEPQNFKEVCQDQNWVIAMEKEIQTLQVNKTWYLTD